MIDVLPDVIGYILILKGLSKLADLDGKISAARQRFKAAVWISSGELFVMLLIPVFDATWYLIFSFLFGVMKLIYLIPAFVFLFEGISYLEIRHTDHKTRRENAAKPKFGGIFDKTEFVSGTAYFELYEKKNAPQSSPDFDETKVYPSILICLGGPQGTLSQGWSYRWNYRLMASQGYVVVLPNRRGTTAFGQEWTEQISGDYCGLNIQDYISAAKALKAEKYIGKMAACGASYGGYSVYYLCGVHGDVFDAFVAHAGIFNEEHMYMTTEEMWFPNWDNGGLHEAEIAPEVGTADSPVGPAGDGETFGGIRQGGSPWSNVPAAKRHYANSPHKFVTNWHTPLLVTHGGMDFRVPADEGMAAYNAAQMMGVPSRLIIFPDENHWILKPQNALFWHREYFGWLDRWCK